MLCRRCCEPLTQAAKRVKPQPQPEGFPRCHAVATYDGPVRAALIAFKERGRRELVAPLGAGLAASVAASLAELTAGPGGLSVLLVPVPSARAAVRQRGRDTTFELAREAARSLRQGGVDAVAQRALRLRRATRDSAGLTVAARAANLAGAMCAEPPRALLLPVRRVVVVDDLLTTGATLTEAARALTAADRSTSGAAVVAATVRRGVGFAAPAR